MSSLISLLFITLSNWSFASEQHTASYAELDEAIEQVFEEQQIPSVAYAVLRKGQTPHIRVLGNANIDSKQPAGLDTQYRIASISKTVVGIAVMQLVESGKINVSDKVSDVLPNLAFTNPWADTHPLRVVHLLESTTGWDEIALKEFHYDNNPPLDLAATLAYNPSSRVSRWPPGTRHAYTNSAAAAAALLVEKVSGMSFFSYVEQFIFKPLDIKSATYDEPDVRGATGYKNNQPVAFDHILMRPAGAISMNVQDIVKLTQLFLARGAPLLSPSTIERIERSESTNIGSFLAGYGIYNYARYYDGRRYRGHDGALEGWLSEMSYSPSQKMGFVVLQNSEQGRGFRRIVTLITDHLANDFDSQQITSESIPDHWQQMSSYYRGLNPRISKRFFIERLIATNKLEVGADGAVFSGAFPPGWRRDLTYAGDDVWQNDKGEVVMKLGNDPIAGQVLHYGDRVFQPVSTFSAWIDKVVLIVWLLLLISVTIYSLFWSIKWGRGKYSNKDAVSARVGMTISGWTAISFIVFMIIGLASPFERLGQVSVISIGLFVSSLLLALVTAWACWRQLTLKNKGVSSFLFWYGATFLVLQLIVVIYLGWFGAIGIQTWT